jgi:hypothetical protein
MTNALVTLHKASAKLTLALFTPVASAHAKRMERHPATVAGFGRVTPFACVLNSVARLARGIRKPLQTPRQFLARHGDGRLPNSVQRSTPKESAIFRRASTWHPLAGQCQVAFRAPLRQLPRRSCPPLCGTQAARENRRFRGCSANRANPLFQHDSASKGRWKASQFTYR